MFVLVHSGCHLKLDWLQKLGVVHNFQQFHKRIQTVHWEDGGQGLVRVRVKMCISKNVDTP